MSRYDIEDFLTVFLIFFALIACFSVLVLFAIKSGNAQEYCLERGYPEYKTDSKGNIYCFSYDFSKMEKK